MGQYMDTKDLGTIKKTSRRALGFQVTTVTRDFRKTPNLQYGSF
jgi:hypothetical protein